MLKSYLYSNVGHYSPAYMPLWYQKTELGSNPMYFVVGTIYIAFLVLLCIFIAVIGAAGLAIILAILSALKITAAIALISAKDKLRGCSAVLCYLLLLLDVLIFVGYFLLTLEYWSPVVIIEDIVLGLDTLLLGILVIGGAVICQTHKRLELASLQPISWY